MLLADSNACICSVTSRAIVDAPTIVLFASPFPSWIGETVSETRIVVPSFRSRLVSRCSTCWPALILARMSVISSVRSP